jgi:hypothetical protein
MYNSSRFDIKLLIVTEHLFYSKVVHEMQPTLHWKEIVYELDHPGFAIKDRQGLILLMKSLKLGFQVQGFPGPFPVDMFYR